MLPAATSSPCVQTAQPRAKAVHRGAPNSQHTLLQLSQPLQMLQPEQPAALAGRKLAQDATSPSRTRAVPAPRLLLLPHLSALVTVWQPDTTTCCVVKTTLAIHAVSSAAFSTGWPQDRVGCRLSLENTSCPRTKVAATLPFSSMLAYGVTCSSKLGSA